MTHKYGLARFDKPRKCGCGKPAVFNRDKFVAGYVCVGCNILREYCICNKETEKKNKKKLNVGCGDDIRAGWVNADKFSPKRNATLDFDDLKSWAQFPDNQFDEVLARHVIEHTVNPIEFLEQIYRVAKIGATVTIIAPHFSLHRSLGNLEHRRPGIGLNSFVFLNPSYRRPYLSAARFRMVGHSLRVEGWLKPITQYLANKFPRFYEHRLSYYIPIEEIEVYLVVVK